MAKKRKQIAEVATTVEKRTVSYILAALGLVAGLAWNEAVKALIDELYPADKATLVAKFVYAFVITLIVVITSFYLSRIIQLSERRK